MLAAPRPRFAAGMASATLLLFLGAQIAAGILVGVVAVILSIAQGGGMNERAVQEAIKGAGPALILASAVVAAGATLLAARMWAWHLVKDRTAGGLGVVAPSRRQLLLAAGAGLALAAIYLAIAQFLIPPRAGTPLGPLMRIASSGWAGRIAFAFVAVALAPPVEELLFRGLLLKGFAESWGLGTSAVIVSVVFVLLHIPEVMHYWPALIAIMVLAGATLAARLWTGSLFAAVAVHAAYNVAMVAASFLSL